MLQRSYGIVAYKKNSDGNIEFLLVKNKSGNHWGFPKGTPDEGEIPQVTARREFEEETGYKAPKELSEESWDEKYDVIRPDGSVFNKISTYWLAHLENPQKVGEVFDDIAEMTWKNFEDALTTLTFKQSKEILKGVRDIISDVE